MSALEIETRFETSPLSMKVGCIIGDSHESARSAKDGTFRGAWLKQGKYYALGNALQAVVPEVCWLNYAETGSGFFEGMNQLRNALSETKTLLFSKTRTTEIDFLLIGSFGRDYHWQEYNQHIVDEMIANVEDMVNLAQVCGVCHCIINDLPSPEDVNDTIAGKFYGKAYGKGYTLPVAEGMKIVEHYRARFENRNDVVFIRDVWKGATMINDGIHPDWQSQLRAAKRIEEVLVKLFPQ